MNSHILYQQKLWDYLRSLLKPEGEGFLLISKLLLLVVVLPLYMVSTVQDLHASTKVDAQAKYILKGTVVSAVDNKPLDGVSVRVEAEKGRTSTKKDGTFSLSVASLKGQIKFTYVGYKSQEINYTAGVSIMVKLIPDDNKLDEVEVVSTGYQTIPKERATGSFEFVDNKLFNRKVSTDFVSRLEDVVPSISSIKNTQSNRGALLNINVRGQSTMSAEKWPLIVVDGIPYPSKYTEFGLGMFNNINPNDIENITVLKDAAASSIWGAQSGNGVIVITTKRGKFDQPFQLDFNSNLTVSQKPDFYSLKQMNSSDYINAEQYLFEKGYWDSRMENYSYTLSPVIQLLKRKKEGSISETELNAELDRLRGLDSRSDYLKYMYRPAVHQQYSLQMRGGGEKLNSSISLGYDDNRQSLVTSSFNRVSLKNNTQYRPIKNLTLDLGISYTQSKSKESYVPMGYNMMVQNYPYLQLADAHGNPLFVDDIPYNPIFRDTVAGGRLLDWKYRPLEEMDQSHQINSIRESMANISVNYQLAKSLKISSLYSYQNVYQPNEIWRGIGTVQQREQINFYTSWDKKGVTWGLPVGDYINTLHGNFNTHQGRFQADFNQSIGSDHEINAIGGAEIRSMNMNSISSVFFGYDPETLSFQSVKYGATVPALNGIAGGAFLTDYNQITGFTNRFVSYYMNGAYSFRQKYTLTSSFRKDASNLFGVKSNSKGQPFWSIGGSWLLSKEELLKDVGFSLLKLRATYGYNGNVNNTTAAYPIIYVQSSPNYTTNQNYASIESPPNPSLRWEKVGMLNIGLDFALSSNRLSGSVEYYVKRPTDLVANTQIDPTTGFTGMNINSADLKGRGVDISINSKNINYDTFKWMSNLVFAYSRTKVEKSYLSNYRAKNYISGPGGLLMTPIEGMDLFSQLSYKWAGLDPVDGSPRGYVNGEVSKDYATMVNSSLVTDLENHGSLQPVYFGSLRNTFQLGDLEFSFNIAYQLGHVFSRESFDNNFFIESGKGHADYARRWQKPGDELVTDVPVFTYPNNSFASQFYKYSSAVIASADQIKLRDLQLSWQIPSHLLRGVKSVRIYGYAQNIWTIWRANKFGIDPEYGKTVRDPFALSVGLNFSL
ncbi:SusC/RagA family TonB-linked outer membrane protein [Sphingobacterium faecium]|uniref:SusC/RagA family TonB-linked outer membrane protein n=1 Tax=Sphingobacterium faecium TaxID=34087 RepID=UPI00320AC2DD